MKKALLTGACGMDATFLAELLHSKGYEVYGIVRLHTHIDRIKKLERLVPGIRIFRAEVKNKEEIKRIVRWIKPDEIYNLLGYSNTFSPYEDTDEVIALNLTFPKHLLEIIEEVDKNIRFFQASSCLTFGKNREGLQDETTSPDPTFVYGVAKCAADQMVQLYRKDRGLFACSGVLFPHESERRGEGFFTKKITSAVARIKNGSQEKIKVGDLSQVRDWTYAGDVVEAMWLMLQQDKPRNYVIGSGKLTSVEKFVEMAFDYVGLNYKDYIQYDENLHRKNDFAVMCADISKIKRNLGWEPKLDITQIIAKMVDFELEKLKNQ